MSEAGVVAVVGSANIDIVLQVARAPRAGETILGSAYQQAAGGKGLNQAVAAAKIASTAFVGSVGVDEAGRGLLAHLTGHGVDSAHVKSSRLPTGQAVIYLTPDGQNSIVVVPMANSDFEGRYVSGALDDIRPDVVLSQCEIPSDAVQAAATWAVRNGAKFVLNASPAAPIEPRVLRAADPVIVNLEEAAALVRRPADEIVQTIGTELRLLAQSVVITLGAEGAWVDDGHGSRLVEPLRVTAVDTTGAGDSFAGTLAALLASGRSLFDATESANQVAAHIVNVPRSERR
jgi:ribokinase